MNDSPHNRDYHSRDHGGGLDAAIAQYSGKREDWIDLSTGINPIPYPLPKLEETDWTALPDRYAQQDLIDAARQFWSVPDGAEILAAPGASVLIAGLPALAPTGRVRIRKPTYNEHAAGFETHGWEVVESGAAEAQVLVHPNNPDGRLWKQTDIGTPFTVIDESFCDICPEDSMVHLTDRPGHIVLKSFGKFWGLAGLRLGFAIAQADTIASLRDRLGPWPVSGPALRIGAHALRNTGWAFETRQRLTRDAAHLDRIMTSRGANVIGGTTLFRLYDVDDANTWQARLARSHIWSRTFPYSSSFLRLGLPAGSDWNRLEDAL